MTKKRTKRTAKSRGPIDVVFVQMVLDMLEYTTPESLAEDLNCDPLDVAEWTHGLKLPTGKKRKTYYHLMECHSLWDEL